MWAWPYAHGGPLSRGRLRASPEDFAVDEVLGFEPDGEGEHWLVRIEKRNANTLWVAARLAEFAGVNPRAVSYSGLKDRHAVTRQWFSIHRPGRDAPRWDTLALEGVRLMRAVRHRRKLRRGSHRFNRFRVRIRDWNIPDAQLDSRLALMSRRGVPNYFGEQRFGRDGANLGRALALFAGARRPGRQQRAFCLSAARAWLFNRVLAVRVCRGSWDRALDGEAFMLDGSASVFTETPVESLCARVSSMDVHPTGPLWGRGSAMVQPPCALLEARVLGHYPLLCDGLLRAGLRAERRSLRLRVRDPGWGKTPDGALELRFRLRRGEFATAVLRELVSG